MTVVIVKNKGEKGEITLAETHEREGTTPIRMLMLAIVVAGIGLLLTAPFLVLEYPLKYDLCICGILLEFIGGFPYLLDYGVSYYPVYYIRSYFTSRTILKTDCDDYDQKSICKAVQEIDAETRVALEQCQKRERKLQNIANNCK